MSNTPYRKVRCPDELWVQLGQAVATHGDTDRSAVTRQLWRLYIDQPAIRKAVHGTPDQDVTPPPDAVRVATTIGQDLTDRDVTVATPGSDVERLKRKVAELRTYGVRHGLTPVDAQDTIRVWLGWYSTQPVHCDFTRIEAALLARASGERWQPLA